MKLSRRIFFAAFVFVTGALPWTAWSQGTELAVLENCRLQDADWADGDSFPVILPDGKALTVRLYGVDCIEAHVRDEADARRLREQRRYFGLSGDTAMSITTAKDFGARASDRTRQWLSKPFTVVTAYADGRGDARYQRVYAFVRTAEGKDLAAQLVKEGLARAHGIVRKTPEGLSAETWREELENLELSAAGRRAGIWAATDWEALPAERQAQRLEDEELAMATGSMKNPPNNRLNLNTASRDELMSLPGIGEKMALRIIEARPFSSVNDLSRVPGIGPVSLEKLRPFFAEP